MPPLASTRSKPPLRKRGLPQGRIGLDYGVYGVPETFVIDRQGVVRYKHIGPLTPEVLRDKVEPLLKRLAG